VTQPPKRMSHGEEVGVGVTEELGLRVSVSALVGVQFEAPGEGRTMLALERTATLREAQRTHDVVVMAKPFGGAVRLTDPAALTEMIGEFRYDSERSRRESDFRLQIHPASWESVKALCRDHFLESRTDVLDSSPRRELAEEFADALNVSVTPDRYRLEAHGMVVENVPRETRSVRAPGRRTVRVYYVFRAWLQEPEMVTAMLDSSRLVSDQDLQRLARQEAAQGGWGRANAALVLARDDLEAKYLSIPHDRRGEPMCIEGHILAGNVPVVLDGVDHPRYQRYDRPSR
jgi:hypothetical protein